MTCLRHTTIEGNIIFYNPRPYILFDALRVAEGSILTLAPGTRHNFHDKGMLQVDGCLRAIGAGNPDFVTPIDLHDMLGIDRLANGNPTLGAFAR